MVLVWPGRDDAMELAEVVSRFLRVAHGELVVAPLVPRVTRTAVVVLVAPAAVVVERTACSTPP